MLLDCLPPGQRDRASRQDSRLSSPFPPNFTKTTMARSTVKISAQFKKGVNRHIFTHVLGQKYPNLGENGRPGGAPKWREKSKKLFFHRFRLIETSTGLQIAPKSLSLVGTVPTDLPAKEFLKKTNPPQVTGQNVTEGLVRILVDRHGSRPISLKSVWRAPQSRYQPNSKRG